MADHLSNLSPASLINFCKGKFDPGGLFKKYLGELITAAVIGALAAALFFAGLYLDVTRLDGQVSQLRSQAAAIYRQTFPDKPLDPDHSPLLLMQSHIKAAKQDQSRRDTDLEKPPAATGLDLLYFLSKSVPKAIDADLTRLLFNQDHATLTGTTDNFNTVDRLKTALEKSSLFTSVTILTAEAEKTGNRVMFKFRVEME
jgi:general secretion pathway protein L